jgi:hypothetical protein
MPDRTQFPIPDPAESIIPINRPVFKEVEDQDGNAWLPDITGALFPEQPLNAGDDLNPDHFPECPPESPLPAGAAAAAPAIAKWMFDTYFALVARRIQIYNIYRRIFNGTPSDTQKGQYRRAARLAIEQILRRDLPPIREWKFHQPILPIFDIQMTFTRVMGTRANPNPPDVETVSRMIVTGTAVVQQRGLDSQGIFVFNNIQPEWSSSSSSSSSRSSFIPD